jgi:polyhydroxybutyrate depolymerase
LPLLAFHGTSDPVVPFEGGSDPTQPGVTIAPIDDSVAAWAGGLGCDATPQTSSPASELELTTYVGCRFGDGAVQLYAVRDGGHTWPGSQPLPEHEAGKTTQQIDASQLIWSFFEAHPRPD